MLDPDVHKDIRNIFERASNEIILPYFRNLSDQDIEEKTPGDLVTIADKKTETFLSDQLSRMFPRASILGEEAVAKDPAVMERAKDDHVIIIDPIDGTGNFAAGREPFGILVALAEAGNVIAGWLYDPLNKRLCQAELNGGAYIDGKLVKATTPAPQRPVAALATGFMTERQREEILNIATQNYEIAPIPNCAAAQYPFLVTGQHQLTVFERTLPWDHAAGVLFLNEAGGKSARWDGTPYRIDDGRAGMLAASSPYLWDEAARLLGHIFTE